MKKQWKKPIVTIFIMSPSCISVLFYFFIWDVVNAFDNPAASAVLVAFLHCCDFIRNTSHYRYSLRPSENKTIQAVHVNLLCDNSADRPVLYLYSLYGCLP
jgi:hypothetical protein